MSYTDKNQINDYLGIVLPSALETQLNKWITAVQQWIDNYVGFTFEGGAVASHRYFDGSGDKELLIDTHFSISSISIFDEDGNDTIDLDLSYIIQYPINSVAKDRLVIISSNAGISRWPNRKYCIDVEAIWGWYETAPEEIKLCATKLMASLLSVRLKGGEAQSESLGDYSITYTDIDEKAKELGITNILDQYRNLKV
jgi:hypothetical protein